MNTDEYDVKWEWEELEEVDSTNRVAMERVLSRWGRAEQAEGLVVVARRQTAGRGQHGRVWESPAGGLYMSMVVDVPVEWRERLALVVGRVVAEALAACGAARESLGIRWPNDVLMRGKKVAGILCEAAVMGERWAAVVGIGVNVERVSLPGELGALATSLAAEGIGTTAQGLAERILRVWEALVREGPALEEIVRRVRERDVLMGRRVRVEEGGGVLEGIGVGIDERGRLLVEVEGSVRAVERGRVIVRA